MSRENFEKVIYTENAETSEGEASTYEKEIVNYVENLLDHQKTIIGKGTIAEVHHLETNPKICYKIVSTNKKYNTVHTTPSNPMRWYNSVNTETDFMLRMLDIPGPVRVPKPYYSVVRTQESIEDEESEGGIDMTVLAMERLNAVSIADILEGRAELPKSFNKNSFFNKLHEFVENMHSKNMYHRDIHEGNIMIDKDTAEPYLIDFGTAAYSSEEDAYREETIRNGKRVTLRFKDDFSAIDSTQTSLIKYMLSFSPKESAIDKAA